MIKIAPSILAADFTRLGEDIDSIKTADLLHFDVMDGVFVPNISFGLPVIKDVRRVTDMPLDVHLMIKFPGKFIGEFCRLGADTVVLHVEAEEPWEIKKGIRAVKAQGKRVGLSVKPQTPVSAIEPYAESLDQILIMSVEPGFGGQGFMPEALPKIEEAARLVNKLGIRCDIEVDGGINRVTARQCEDAGATILVAGSTVFRAADRAEEIRVLRGN